MTHAENVIRGCRTIVLLATLLWSAGAAAQQEVPGAKDFPLIKRYCFQGHTHIPGIFTEDRHFNSPDDIVVGPDKAIYFTDSTLDLPKGQAQKIPYQEGYRVDRDGAVQLVTRELKHSNGLAFSPNGKYLYVDDTEYKAIRRFRFHRKGMVTKGQIFA